MGDGDPSSGGNPSSQINQGDTAWDAYACPTRNMPGYDSNNHWMGMEAWMDQVTGTNRDYLKRKRRSTASTGRTTKVHKRKSPDPSGGRHRKGMPNGKKAEPNWSFKQKKSDSCMVKKKVTHGELVGKIDLATRIMGKPAKQKVDESYDDIIYDDYDYKPVKYVKMSQTSF